MNTSSSEETHSLYIALSSPYSLANKTKTKENKKKEKPPQAILQPCILTKHFTA